MDKYNVFLAEDDADDRYSFLLALNEFNENITLHTAENGQEVIDLLHGFESVPDIVILDINMPRKNGLDALQEIRKSSRFQATPVVIFSTGIDTRSINDAKKFGADFYIQKPSNFTKLKNIIRFCLDLSVSRNSNGQMPFLIAEPYDALKNISVS